MRGQWFAGYHGQGTGDHHGEPVTFHVRATNTKGCVEIGLSDHGDPAGAKASIMLTGQQAKGFVAALEKAMTRAGLREAS